MLKKYLKENKITYQEFADKISISKQAVADLIKNRSPKTKVQTCIAIQRETGLPPWDYLDGLEDLKKLKQR